MAEVNSLKTIVGQDNVAGAELGGAIFNLKKDLCFYRGKLLIVIFVHRLYDVVVRPLPLDFEPEPDLSGHDPHRVYA